MSLEETTGEIDEHKTKTSRQKPWQTVLNPNLSRDWSILLAKRKRIEGDGRVARGGWSGRLVWAEYTHWAPSGKGRGWIGQAPAPPPRLLILALSCEECGAVVRFRGPCWMYPGLVEDPLPHMNCTPCKKRQVTYLNWGVGWVKACSLLHVTIPRYILFMNKIAPHTVGLFNEWTNI